MKKLFIIVMVMVLFLFSAPLSGTSDNQVNQMTFTWFYTSPVPADMVWELFMRDAGASYDYNTPISSVPHDGTLSLAKEITISGESGDQVTKYFILRARRGEIHSGDSNEVEYDFQIPLLTPHNLTITINIVVQ